MPDDSAALCLAARSLAKIARIWGDETVGNIPQLKEDKKAVTRARCCLFFTYSINCYRGGALSPDDIKALLQSVVLAHHNHLLGDDDAKDSEKNKQIERQTVMAACVLTRRLHEIIAIVKRDLEIPTGQFS